MRDEFYTASRCKHNAKQFNGEKSVREFSPDLIRAARPVVAHEPRSINPRSLLYAQV